MWMPPIGVRRIFLDPLFFLLALVALLLSPLLFAAAFIADLFIPGRWKALRFTTLSLTFMLYEVLGLITVFALWVASGFGIWIHTPRFRVMHYAVLRWWIRGISPART